ncbi:GH32 C-terminal domain-containing protein [Nucisporomicrobium flavum]|uniref:GH32 C-terminal domain-containing protein n=1 Tax=Nucisporomicrobium flavum TaxID=2785915 RepID=UPI0018F37F44|nr:glycoside hydrolase family 32 protein [Nucisporomicrobium flavum]
MRLRGLSVLVLIVAIAVVVPGRPAAAGAAGDYPEYPYAPTAYAEPNRGQFHFSAANGWMNDVNAPLHADGVYHLFFQHNPHGLQWDTMHWGHATSPDLVHWTQRPIALEPGVHPGNLFSGGGVVDSANTSGLRTGDRAPIVVFTGTDGVSVAFSNDGGETFQPYDHGRKVITMPAESRDPKVFWHEPTRRWVMVVWSGAGGNAAHLYTSPDLLTWTFRSRYAADWLFECPDMFPLRADGDGVTKWILNDASGEYVVGSFDGTTFAADSPTPKRMDEGDTRFDGSWYAGLTFSNLPDGRTVQMAWMPGNHGSVWTGSATFPVELGLRTYPDGLRVTRTPISELDSLRLSSTQWTDRTLNGDPAADPLREAAADAYELTAEFDAGTATAARFGFRLGVRPDGTAAREVAYDRAAGTLDGAALPPDHGRVRVRMLVDRGQVETFGDEGRVSVTRTVAFDASGVRTFADGGSVRLLSLRLTPLRPAWGAGEPTLRTDVAGPWHADGGTWTDTADGKRGEASGDGFYLGAGGGTDFTYDADVRLDTATAAGVMFRGAYTLNVDAGAGVMKLWRPGRDIAAAAAPVARGRFHHLRVVAEGNRFRAYLDHNGTALIDATDDAYASGAFGLNVFQGAAVVQNARIGAAPWRQDVGGTWSPASGTWTTPSASLAGRSAGDGFYLSGRTGRDFTYEADLRVVAGRAAGLTFRATPGASGHYTANIDTDGYVKLWRPGRDIAVQAATVVPGRTYHLRVVAAGPQLEVSLDGTVVIRATDDAYAEGRFGVNVFDGSCLIERVSVR